MNVQLYNGFISTTVKQQHEEQISKSSKYMWTFDVFLQPLQNDVAGLLVLMAIQFIFKTLLHKYKYNKNNIFFVIHVFLKHSSLLYINVVPKTRSLCPTAASNVTDGLKSLSMVLIVSNSRDSST